MNNLSAMIWVELQKAIRSRMPLWTGIGSLFMPLTIAFLIFIARNPEISRKLGLISVKADLIAYSATDWPAYLGLSAQMIAMGGFFLSILATSWTFGREFADGTLKDILAVPVPRASIILAKFIVVALWSAMLTLIMLTISLVMGALLGLPGGSTTVILNGSVTQLVIALMTIVVVMPFALVTSIGRGYLLPLGIAVLTMIMTNVVAIAGWGEYFPWAIPGLFAQGKTTLTSASYVVVALTGLAGILLTSLWWKVTDQNR